MKVLVVDVNADAAVPLGLLLRVLGHAATVVRAPDAAVQAVASGPDAVLLDIGLPGTCSCEADVGGPGRCVGRGIAAGKFKCPNCPGEP